MSLQAKLMIAVTGLTSLVLIVISLVTTALLGQSLEDQLHRPLSDYADALTRQLVAPLPQSQADITNVLDGRVLDPRMIVAVSSASGGTSGVVFVEGTDQLHGEQSPLTPRAA